MEKEKANYRADNVDSDCADHSDHVANEEQRTSPFDRLATILWLTTLYLAIYLLFPLLLNY